MIFAQPVLFRVKEEAANVYLVLRVHIPHQMEALLARFVQQAHTSPKQAKHLANCAMRVIIQPKKAVHSVLPALTAHISPRAVQLLVLIVSEK